MYASLLAALLFCLINTTVITYGEAVSRAPKKFKYLFFPFEITGSHYMHMRQTGKALVRKGHDVTFLISSSQSASHSEQKSPSDPFSFLSFPSRHTEADRVEKWKDINRMALKGNLGVSLLDQVHIYIQASLNNQTFITDLIVDECDDLLGNLAFMDALREEKFDMVVGDNFWKCYVILAHALNVPFVKSGNLLQTIADDFYMCVLREVQSLYNLSDCPILAQRKHIIKPYCCASYCACHNVNEQLVVFMISNTLF